MVVVVGDDRSSGDSIVVSTDGADCSANNVSDGT